MIMGSNANEGAGFVKYTLEGPGEEALAEATLRFSYGTSGGV